MKAFCELQGGRTLTLRALRVPKLKERDHANIIFHTLSIYSISLRITEDVELFSLVSLGAASEYNLLSNFISAPLKKSINGSDKPQKHLSVNQIPLSSAAVWTDAFVD